MLRLQISTEFIQHGRHMAIWLKAANTFHMLLACGHKNTWPLRAIWTEVYQLYDCAKWHSKPAKITGAEPRRGTCEYWMNVIYTHRKRESEWERKENGSHSLMIANVLLKLIFLLKNVLSYMISCTFMHRLSCKVHHFCFSDSEGL